MSWWVIIIITYLLKNVLCWVALLERAEIVYEDKNIVELNISVVKFNRTTFAFNLYAHYKVDLPENTMVEIRLKGVYSNQYRELPINIKRSFCDALNNEFKFVSAEMHGHFPKKCPVKKGYYSWTDFVPNTKNMPFHIPWKTQNYVLTVMAYMNNKKCFALDVYLRTNDDDEYVVL